MIKSEQETLWGVVEEIIYHNDDNDYTVMEIINKEGALVTVVGKIAYVAEGEEVTLYGNWGTHPEYGKQFAFENYERELPTGKKAILRYLSSRVIKGVGPVTASRIVARYGEETFDVMEHHPEWLAEIAGISPKKAAEIHRSFMEQTGVRALMMLCRDFFTTAVIGRVYQKWGASALERTKENPYALCASIYGVSFEAADRLAAALGFSHNAPERIEGGLRYILEFNAQNNGHTCLPEDKLISAAATHLAISEDEATEALRRAVAEGVLSTVRVMDAHFVALPVYATDEKTVAERLTLLDRFCALFSDRDCALFIKRLEEEQGIIYAEAQRRAISAALSSGVMILTGGPGTGKTTVVRALLRIFESADLKTLMLAPTGRAANRMSAAAVCEAKTIHRA
ncbi:MAG: AAA family ATPase, partial [Clostridia bacterium]|nr:AAA family ATPase [Clostridia bacterium]